MTDASVNCIINEADRLEKRKGLIRGLDERFGGVVCGLHAFTDECGREWLIVGDETGFSIRQPFFIPSFGNSDAYPSDDFQANGPVNENYWQNTSGYAQAGGGLVLATGVSSGGILRWFKDASNFSYELEVSFTIVDGAQVVAIIKQGAIASIRGRIAQDGDEVMAELVWVSSAAEETILGAVILSVGVEDGIFTVSYIRDSVRNIYTAQLIVQPTGGTAEQLQDITTINAVADADLGQGTGVELTATASSPSIPMVQGGPL